MRRKRTFRKFEDWHAHDVEQKLGLSLNENLRALGQWLATETDYPEHKAELLEDLRTLLLRFHGNWNEAELQFQFISPLLHSIDFRGYGFNCFQERKLSAQIDGFAVEGYVDWMTASGSYEPITPYFFLHEYKRQKGFEADPLGQLLISMLAAATRNADGKPIYGCYVLGRYWSFVLLEGREYGFSQGFDALDRGELGRIWHTLRHTRELIARRVAEEHNLLS